MNGVKYTLLIVEDNYINLLMLRRRLEKHNFRIIEQADGNHLLSCLEKARPDLILMDMNLPGIQGWDLARKLKSEPQTRSLPVIAVTAFAMKGDREKVLQAGCDEYISKPIDFQRLLKMIEGQLKARQESVAAAPEAAARRHSEAPIALNY